MDWTANSALRRQVLEARQKRVRRQIQSFQPPHLVQPLIIVSAPRAGSTLLLETLANFPELWTIGEESHEIFEGIPALHPAARGYASNRLGAADLTPALAEQLCDRFARQLRDRTGRLWIELPLRNSRRLCACWRKPPKMRCGSPSCRRFSRMPVFCFCIEPRPKTLPAFWMAGRADVSSPTMRFLAGHQVAGAFC